MTSTAVEPITIPPVNEHALVQRHARQREELEKKLTAAQSRRAELLGEREELRRLRHTHDVAVLLGDRASEEQPDVTRLAARG